MEKLSWIGLSIQKWAEEVDFLKRWVKYAGYTQTKIGKILNVHKSDVSGAFNLNPRNKRIVVEIIDLLGFKVEESEDKLLLKDNFYFLHAAPESVFAKWSPFFLDLGFFLKRNYNKGELIFNFLFNLKVVPYVIASFEDKTFLIKCEKIKLGLADFLFAHVYSAPIWEGWTKVDEKIPVNFRAIPLSTPDAWIKLDVVFEEKDTDALERLLKDTENYRFPILV